MTMHSINLTITTTKTSILHMSDDQRCDEMSSFSGYFTYLITILMIMLGFIDQINIKLSNT